MMSGISGFGGSLNLMQMQAMQGQREHPFKKFDSDGDGSLGKTEIGSFADKISKMTGQSVSADQLISKLDTDEDGLINQEEFDLGRPKDLSPGMMGGMQPGGMLGGDMSSSLLDMLNGSEDDGSSSDDSLDTNGNGVVDLEEMRAGLSKRLGSYVSNSYSLHGQSDQNINSLMNMLG